MEERKTMASWIKKHKPELLIFSFAVVTVAGTTLIVKNWDSINAFFKQSEATLPQLPVVEKTVSKTVVPTIPHEIAAESSGELRTTSNNVIITIPEHIRNLTGGKKPSAAKIATAQEHNFELGEHQTGVENYTRRRNCA